MRPYRSRPESREPSTASTSRASNDQHSDWELNCEVCLKHTRNQVRNTFLPPLFLIQPTFHQDDDVPIICCGSCNVWQHIPCHEEMDRRDGRPPHDWEREEFYCSRCRSKSSVNGHGASSTLPPYAPQQTKMQLRWDHGRSGAIPPGPAQLPYTGVPADRRDYYQMPPASGTTNGGYHFPHPLYNGHPPSLPTSVDQYSNISFSHYQPHQRGFTSRHPQPPTHNSTHYPNTHHPHPQPTHNTSPIYPTYTNGTTSSTMQGYPGQPSFGGHYRPSASALPLQVSQSR